MSAFASSTADGDDWSPSGTDRTFSSLRAWGRLLNHEPRLGTAALLLLPAAMLLLLPVSVLINIAPLLIHGGWTTGTVTRCDVVAVSLPPSACLAGLLAHGGGGNRGGPRWMIAYTYGDQRGVLHHGAAAVSRSVWSQQQPGGSVDVVYRYSDPDQHRLWLAIRSTVQVATGMSLAAGLLTLIAGAMACAGCVDIAREVQLLRDGALTVATITEVSTLGDLRRNGVQQLKYEYDAPLSFAGPPQTLTGEYTARGVRQTGSQPGDRMAALYDPRSPDRSLLDWHHLRSLPVNPPGTREKG